METEEPAPSLAALPVDLLRLILSKLLGSAPLEAYPLVKAWQNYALVCKAWLDAARTTPLRVNLAELLELDDGAIDWLCGVTLEQLELSPTHYTIDLFRHRPQFQQRSGRTLRRLLGAQLAAEPADALQPGDFPHLEELDLHADYEDEVHHFDSACVAGLSELRSLTLSDFQSAGLSRLPCTLRTLDLLVYHNEPLELPPALQLERLALMGGTMYVRWDVLCGQVSDYLAVTARAVVVLRPPGATAPADAEAVMRLLTGGFVAGKVAHAEVTLNYLVLAEPDPEADPEDVSWRYEAPVDMEEPYPKDPRYRHLAAINQMEVAAQLQEAHSRQFGTFVQLDAPVTEDEIDLFDATRFELVRHSEGEPLQLGFARELPQQQIDFLLSGVQVKRLALEQVPRAQVAAILNSPAFRDTSAVTLKLLEGVELDAGLELAPYEALEDLVAYVAPGVELGRQLLPRNLVHLELCGETAPAGMTPEQLDQLLAALQQAMEENAAPPALPPPPALRFEGGWLVHCRQLKELALTAIHSMDLSQHLPDSLTSILIQDPDYQHYLTTKHRAPYSLRLPRELPAGVPTREAKFHFGEAPPSEGGNRWAPMVELDGLLGGVTHVSIRVEEDMPEGEEVPPEEDATGIWERKGWVLTVRCGGITLADVMRRVTDSPLQSICFDALVVRFQGGLGGPTISSIKMQEYIEQNWGEQWRIIPLDDDRDESDSDLEELDEELGGPGSDGDGGSEDYETASSEGYGGGAAGGRRRGRRRGRRSYSSSEDERSSEGMGSDSEELSSLSSRGGRGDAFTLKRR